MEPLVILAQCSKPKEAKNLSGTKIYFLGAKIREMGIVSILACLDLEHCKKYLQVTL